MGKHATGTVSRPTARAPDSGRGTGGGCAAAGGTVVPRWLRSLDRGRYVVGQSYRHAGLLRSARDVRIATDNFLDRDVVVIYGADGRDVDVVSEHPEEGETVFWPDPVFTVIARSEADDGAGRSSGDRAEPERADRPLLTVLVVHGRRGDVPPNVTDAVERAMHAIAGSRSLGQAIVARPGRYRGAIGVDEHGQLNAVT